MLIKLNQPHCMGDLWGGRKCFQFFILVNSIQTRWVQSQERQTANPRRKINWQVSYAPRQTRSIASHTQMTKHTHNSQDVLKNRFYHSEKKKYKFYYFWKYACKNLIFFYCFLYHLIFYDIVLKENTDLSTSKFREWSFDETDSCSVHRKKFWFVLVCYAKWSSFFGKLNLDWGYKDGNCFYVSLSLINLVAAWSAFAFKASDAPYIKTFL